MLRHAILFPLSVLGLLASFQVFASISLSSTRVIFDGARKEANVTVRNGAQKVLVQSWIDGDDTVKKSLPFAVTPPLVRVEANERQLLRILYEGGGMPSDKESVLWLNVQEIPQASAADANTLQLAVRQRIKVFFRPVGLPGEAAQAPEHLIWQLESVAEQSVLKVKNPSAYHVSMADLKMGNSQNFELVVDSTMIAPGEERIFKLKAKNTTQPVSLWFSSINDYGALQKFETTLSERTPIPARAKEVSEN